MSDGILGLLEVRNMLFQGPHADKPDTCHTLFVNNVIQSSVDRQGNSLLEYTKLIKKNILAVSNPRSALLLGLGGGMLANDLARENIKVTAVELDERVISISKEYFHLDPSIEVINDDARHSINKLERKFDVIVVDLFHGEITPSHVLSEESFLKMRSLLNENGLLVVNTYGFLSDKSAYGNFVLLKTLQEAGFQFKICYVGDKTHEDYRNFEVFASLKPLEGNLSALLEENIPSLAGIPINTDMRPILEFANADAAKRWRYSYLKNNSEPL